MYCRYLLGVRPYSGLGYLMTQIVYLLSEKLTPIMLQFQPLRSQPIYHLS